MVRRERREGGRKREKERGREGDEGGMERGKVLVHLQPTDPHVCSVFPPCTVYGGMVRRERREGGRKREKERGREGGRERREGEREGISSSTTY